MRIPSGQHHSGENGLSAVFQNRNFTLLWVSQVFGQSAQNAIFFVQMVMVEELTRSSALVGLMVLCSNLPAILFGLLSGILIDYLPKKMILLLCNVSRIFVVAAFVFFNRYTRGGGLLTAVYVLTFILSTIGQLSDPAEAAMVPLLVPPQHLLAANSVFYLLFNVAQVLGLLFLAPLALKFGGVDGAFVTISLTYLITAALIWPIAVHERKSNRRSKQDIFPYLWQQLKMGGQFILARKTVLIAICQHALINMLTTIIAVLAPGFATRVLGMDPTDAIYIFFSAGLGMFLVTLWTGQRGYRFRREALIAAGLLITGLALLGLAFVARNGEVMASIPPQPSQQMSIQVMLMAVALGAGMTLSVVSAQTIVQEQSPEEIRGRVLAAQFMSVSLVTLPPTLFIGGLADYIGIPSVILGLAVLVITSAVLSYCVRPAQRGI